MAKIKKSPKKPAVCTTVRKIVTRKATGVLTRMRDAGSSYMFQNLLAFNKKHNCGWKY